MDIKFLTTTTLALIAWLTLAPAYTAVADTDSPSPGFAVTGLASTLAKLADPLPITLEAKSPGDEPGDRLAPKIFEFLVEGNTMTLLLRPHTVRSPDFQVKKQVVGGAFVAHPPPPTATMRGVVVEIRGATVAASELPEGVTAFILVPNGDDLFITPQSGLAGEPSSEHVLSRWQEGQTFDLGPGHHGDRLYEDSDLLEGKSLSLGGANDCALDGLCVADLALDTDFSVFDFEGSADRVVDVADGIVNMANLRYEDQLSIRHRLKTVVVRTSLADDPYDPSLPGCGPNTCGPLSRMILQWCPACFSDIVRDSVHLFTRYLPPGIGGLAVEGGMCSSSQGRGFSGHQGLVVPGLGLAIHEVGHQWGAGHSCGIMSNGSSDALEPFCSISLSQIRAKRDLIDGSCLDLVIPDDSIFTDALESGTFDAWTAAEDDGGRLFVFAKGRVIFGDYSLGADLTGPQPIWLQDDWPNGETRYRARFYVDATGLAMDPPTGLVPTQADPVTIFAASSFTGTDRLTIELRQGTGIVPYEIRAVAHEDDTSLVATPWTGVLDACFMAFGLEVDLQASTAPGATDGTLSLSILGQGSSAVSGLDNDQAAVDFARIGVLEVIDHPSTRGFLAFDAFESRRANPIGPAGLESEF